MAPDTQTIDFNATYLMGQALVLSPDNLLDNSISDPEHPGREILNAATKRTGLDDDDEKKTMRRRTRTKMTSMTRRMNSKMTMRKRTTR